MARERPLHLKPKDRAAIVDQPRMQALYAAALRCQGRVVDMVRELGVTRRRLQQRLSILRREGVSGRSSVRDPRRIGWPIETVVLLRASRFDTEGILALEAQIRSDPHVTNAGQVSGVFDYRLVTFHRDRAAAIAWRNALAENPAIVLISQRIVETQCA